MKRKRYFAVLLAVLLISSLALGLVACKPKKPKPEPDPINYNKEFVGKLASSINADLANGFGLDFGAKVGYSFGENNAKNWKYNIKFKGNVIAKVDGENEGNNNFAI